MSKLIAAIVASVFAVGVASAQTTAPSGSPAGKREQLTAEQKTEIRDRAERLKADRARADAAKATTPSKADAPKKTSKVGKQANRVAKAATGKTVKKAKAKAKV